MSPDISRLRVHAKDGLEALPERVQRRSVTFHEEVVVFEPLGQVLVVHNHPASCPDSLRKLFRSLERAQRHGTVSVACSPVCTFSVNVVCSSGAR